VRVGKIAAEGGLAVGAGRHEPQVGTSTIPSLAGDEARNRLAALDGNRYFVARSLTHLGELALTTGDRLAACTYLEEAVELNRDLGDRQGLSWSLLAVGIADPDVDHARRYCLESLEVARASGDPISLARGLDGFAGLIVSTAPESAVRLLAASESLRTRYGAARSREEHERVQRVSATARQLLGQLRFKQIWDEGQCLSIDGAISLAKRVAVIPHTHLRQPVPGKQQSSLSSREQDVAGLVAQGMTNRQIAETLSIAERTAEHHVENILAKLDFTSRTQLALWAAARVSRQASTASD
jgi:non-specific serine/threonine protein kinase